METRAARLAQIANNEQRPLSGVAAALIRGGHVTWRGSCGRRFISTDKQQPDLPVTVDTAFRVASISKLVTTLGLMSLVDQQLVELDANVERYVGFALRNPHFPERPITLRHLLTHTSSMRDATAYSLPLPHQIQTFFEPGSVYYEEGAHWAQPSRDSRRGPGDYFTYCNLNFGVIATVMEAVTGERFDLLMRRLLFDPLEIKGGFNVSALSDDVLSNLAVLYRRRSADGQWQPNGPWVPQVDNYGGQRPRPLSHVENPDVQEKYAALFAHVTPITDLSTYQIGTNGTLFSPQGGARLSLMDLVKIAQLLINRGSFGGRRVLSSTAIEAMVDPQWRYDSASANGDTYDGLMRAWGLGVHLLTSSGKRGDGERLVADQDLCWIGHFGEAYGLLSGLFIDPESGDGLVYLIGGLGADPEQHLGQYSSMTIWEEEIVTALLTE